MRFFACILALLILVPHVDADAKSKARASHSRAKVKKARARYIPATPSAQRHAALVMDADTGDILFEQSAHEQRYPASLTKMMTLYMVFDGLKTGKLKLQSKMTASKKAAAMPRTNVSLRPGDTITVEQAIKAVVVVSANDAAVVFAETLGGSEWNFGVMMTNKARSLGMKDSVFRNANGLPDTRQHTTAYDLAILGRALRRDFPQYYSYFSTRSFDMAGRHYNGHNRVLDRLDGVDGIKTGFINASGFNLVSSMKHNGVNLVAVVMGGNSGAARDNEMVALLQKHYDIVLAEHQQHPGRAYARAGTRPTAITGSGARPQVEVADATPPVLPPIPVETASVATPPTMSIALSAPSPVLPRIVVRQMERQAALPPQAAAIPAPRLSAAVVPVAGPAAKSPPAASPASAAQAPARMPMTAPTGGAPIVIAGNGARGRTTAPIYALPVSTTVPRPPLQQPVARAAAPAAPTRGKSTLDYQFAMLGTTASDAPSLPAIDTLGRDWGVQVGAFRNSKQAKDAATSAVGNVAELKQAYLNITSEGSSDSPIHRARLGNLSRIQAEVACRKLNAMNAACFPLRMN